MKGYKQMKNRKDKEVGPDMPPFFFPPLLEAAAQYQLQPNVALETF